MRRHLPPALRERDFALVWGASLALALPTQMIAVAIGWQVYAIGRNPFHLGLIGLLEFLPLLVLALPAGHLADRFSRRLVLTGSIALHAAIAACLLVVTLGGATQLWPFLALAAATGMAAALGTPAARALPPMVVSAGLLASALSLRSAAFQMASIAGPALGGVLFGIRPELVYAVAIALFTLAALLVSGVRERSVPARRHGEETPGLASVLAGVGFIRRTPVLLGAISLDLFAVLFGGAVALLPVFARDVLHVGPAGLGVLRSAPAVGALVAAVVLAHRAVGNRAGRKLLLVVAVFGAATIAFGLSRSFALSLVALAVAGAADMVSVNIRSTLVALASPDELRGRVLAVEMVFISASNELGAFESGTAAALIGAVPAVVAGGAATLLVAALWLRLFPGLARVGRLEELRPATVVDT